MTSAIVVDLDGTLIAGNSFRQWMRFLAHRCLLHGRLITVTRLVVAALLRKSGLIDRATLKRTVLAFSTSMLSEEVAVFAEGLARQARPEVLSALEACRDGNLVMLATAAPDLYLGALQDVIRADCVVATHSDVTLNRWDEVVGEIKRDRVSEHLGPDGAVDTLFTDHADDLPLARLARRVVLVEPSTQTLASFREAGLTVEVLASDTVATRQRAVAALMVTHNSEAVAPRAVEALVGGEHAPELIIIVDNGSNDTTYLDGLAKRFSIVEIMKLDSNLGFCAGNNHGMRLVGDRHVLLINPDAFVGTRFLREALNALEADSSVGAIGPKLLGANPRTGRATGLIDSAGIGQTSWGRLFDKGTGEPDVGQFDVGPHEPVALCAAAILLRREAVLSVTRTDSLFDERFFMYKEDIDLSWRLRRAGWKLVMDPSLVVLHCRGWNADRRAMPGWARRRSLSNEWRLWLRGWTPGKPRWASLPYLTVKAILVWLGR